MNVHGKWKVQSQLEDFEAWLICKNELDCFDSILFKCFWNHERFFLWQSNLQGREKHFGYWQHTSHLNSHYFLLDLQVLYFAERSTSVVFGDQWADRERERESWEEFGIFYHLICTYRRVKRERERNCVNQLTIEVSSSVCGLYLHHNTILMYVM